MWYNQHTNIIPTPGSLSGATLQPWADVTMVQTCVHVTPQGLVYIAPHQHRPAPFYSCLLPSLTWANTKTFYISVVLSFQKRYLSEVIQHAIFQDFFFIYSSYCPEDSSKFAYDSSRLLFIDKYDWCREPTAGFGHLSTEDLWDFS